MAILKYLISKQWKISTNSIYSGTHWTKRKKIADYYHQIVKLDCKQLKPYDKKVKIDFKFYFKSRYLDSSNCSFIGKCLEDGLVKGGLLKDDTNTYIGKVSYESVLLDKKERKELNTDYVRIIIQEQ